MGQAFKILSTLIFLLLGGAANALSNSEVRNAIQEWISTQEFPQDMGDELTILVGSRPTTRGILYNYKLKLDQDDLKNVSQVFDSIEINALKGLCTNPAMAWYKNNEVEMTYRYMDEKKNVITIFKIHVSDC